jgi:hypothetical protein
MRDAWRSAVVSGKSLAAAARPSQPARPGVAMRVISVQ